MKIRNILAFILAGSVGLFAGMATAWAESDTEEIEVPPPVVDGSSSTWKGIPLQKPTTGQAKPRYKEPPSPSTDRRTRAGQRDSDVLKGWDRNQKKNKKK